MLGSLLGGLKKRRQESDASAAPAAIQDQGLTQAPVEGSEEAAQLAVVQDGEVQGFKARSDAQTAGSRRTWQWRQEKLKAKLSRPAPSHYDITSWADLSKYARALEVGTCLSQKGFCLIKSTVPAELRSRAMFEAMEHFRVGNFQRPPYEVLSGLLGEIGSAWTVDLGNPEVPAGADCQALREVEQQLWHLGTELASCSRAKFGMHLTSYTGGLLHRSRTAEEREPNPPLAMIEEADHYINLFSNRKLRLLFYIGPSPATLHVSTLGPEAQAFSTQLEAGAIVVIRMDACRCAVDPRSTGSGHTLEVDFLTESKHSPLSISDRIPLPESLHEWYLGRLQAIVENDITEDLPEHWLKSAREMFFKCNPIRVRNLAYELPTSGTGGGNCPFSGLALGGYDAIVEIPKSKWDMDVYFDADPMAADDFKMYTRHMGVLEGDPICPQDFMPSELMPAGEARGAHEMVASSSMQSLHLSGLARNDVFGKPVGVFCGVSGNDMYYQLLSREVSLSKCNFSELGNAGLANRLSHALGCTGPSLVVNTEDSSGSCAVDTAIAYIRQDRCDQALAAGVNSVRHPFALVMLCASGKLSRKGRSRAFDQSCDGYVSGEGVVSLVLEAHSWRRKRKERDVFMSAEELEDDSDGEEPDFRALIMGSALNSQGSTASFAVRSAPALRLCIRRALEDAQIPGGIVDTVEASAGGSALNDAMEFAATRKEMQGHGEDGPSRSPLWLGAFKSSIGEIGVPSGLAALARSIVSMEHTAHGPALHGHQLLELASTTLSEVEDESDSTAWRAIVNSEMVSGSNLTQTVGVSSFGSTGTNVHHILWGIKKLEQARITPGPRLHWFPTVSASDDSKVDYYIMGTWTAWEAPQKMTVEAPGIYSHTLTLGDNRWETFQLWVDGDSDQVLHPKVQWAGKDTEVCGPSKGKVCGRFLTWRLDGRGEEVRLINEEQAERLRASGEGPSEPVAVVFKGDSKPSGHEQATIADMPLVQSAPELRGVPGDRYVVRLHVQGSYRRVEWRKVEIDPDAKMLADAEQPHSYYVVGSCNFWSFAQMEAQAGGVHVAEVELQTRGGGFHIVRDKDWDQMFYPPIAKECTDKEDNAIRGPDGSGLGKSWRLEGKVGDVFRITFHRTVEGDISDIRSVQCSLVRKAAKSSASKVARNPNHKYFLVGSWSNFTKLKEMSYEDAEKGFAAEVMIGESGREAFQILLNGNWLSAVHPSTNMASCFDKDHVLQGPDDAGASRHWLIGQHPAGELQPGDRVKIVMGISSGLPHSITWRKVK